jgi:ubiquitin C-terminal hydrolase
MKVNHENSLLGNDHHGHESRAFIMQGKVGLESYGFTCFFNSTLQALAHVEPLSILSRGLPLNYSKRNGLNCVDHDEKFQRHEFAYLFQRVVRELWVNKRAVVNPSYLLRSLNRGWSVFDEDELDVHDVYLCVLESLHRALGVFAPVRYEPQYQEPRMDWNTVEGGSRRGSRAEGTYSDDYHSDSVNSEAEDDFVGAPEVRVLDRSEIAMRAMDVGENSNVEHCKMHFVKSMVTDTMQGVTMCRVECTTCQSCTYSSEPYFSLSLDFPDESPTLGGNVRGRRRASTIIQSKDGAEEAQLFSIGDLLESYQGDDNNTKGDKGQTGSSSGSAPPIQRQDSTGSASTIGSGTIGSVNKHSIRLHRSTSSRVWCRRGNGMDSIRVPMPNANPFASTRRDMAGSQRPGQPKSEVQEQPGLFESIKSSLSPNQKPSHSAKREISLLTLLDHHFKATRVASTRFKCTAKACQNSVSTGAHKQVSMVAFPEVLVLNIRRGTFSPSTAPPSVETIFHHTDQKVTFPMEDLDLAPYMQPSPWYNSDFSRTGQPLYNLQSVIVYDVKPGEAQGRHTNYSRHYNDTENGAWYAFIDQHVKEVPVDVVVNATASMLFYVRQVPLGPKYREHRVSLVSAVRPNGNVMSNLASKARASLVVKRPVASVPSSPHSPGVMQRKLSMGNAPASSRPCSYGNTVASATTQLNAKTKREVLKLLRTESLRAIESHDEDVQNSRIVVKKAEEKQLSFLSKVGMGINSHLRRLMFGEEDEEPEEDVLDKFKKTAAGRILGNKNKGSNHKGAMRLAYHSKAIKEDVSTSDAERANSENQIVNGVDDSSFKPNKMRSLIVALMDKLDFIMKVSVKALGKPVLSGSNFKDEGGQPPVGYIVVSSYWLLKFLSFSDPGPPCNHDIACPHGALKPHLRGAGKDVFVPLQWNFFIEILQLLNDLYGHSGDLINILRATKGFALYSENARGLLLGTEEVCMDEFRPIRELEICTACNRRQTMLYWRRRQEKQAVLKQRVQDEKDKIEHERHYGRGSNIVSAPSRESPTSNLGPDSLLKKAGLDDSFNSNVTTSSGWKSDEVSSPEFLNTPVGVGLEKLVNSERKVGGSIVQRAPSTDMSDVDDWQSSSGEGRYCNIIEKRWLDQWRAYVSTDPGEDLEYSNPAPGPISNDVLFRKSPSGELEDLLPDLAVGTNYEAVSPGVWDILHNTYNGGPALPRKYLDIYAAPPVSPSATP